MDNTFDFSCETPAIDTKVNYNKNAVIQNWVKDELKKYEYKQNYQTYGPTSDLNTNISRREETKVMTHDTHSSRAKFQNLYDAGEVNSNVFRQFDQYKPAFMRATNSNFNYNTVGLNS